MGEHNKVGRQPPGQQPPQPDEPGAAPDPVPEKTPLPAKWTPRHARLKMNIAHFDGENEFSVALPTSRPTALPADVEKPATPPSKVPAPDAAASAPSAAEPAAPPTQKPSGEEAPASKDPWSIFRLLPRKKAEPEVTPKQEKK